MTKFHEILKSFRLTQGYSQTHFAKLLNVSRRSYQYYETGKKLPSPEKLTEIANFLGVSVDHLLGVSTNSIADQFKNNSIVNKFQTQDFSSTPQQIDIALDTFYSAYRKNDSAWSDLSSLIINISLYQINKDSKDTELVTHLEEESLKLLKKLNSDYAFWADTQL